MSPTELERCRLINKTVGSPKAWCAIHREIKQAVGQSNSTALLKSAHTYNTFYF